MGIGFDLKQAAADEEDRKAGAALRALEEWHRKHYTAAIHLCNSVMPGDEGWVELAAGGRKVVVDFHDLTVWDEKEDEYSFWPSTADLIREALRRWHADDAPKWFQVCLDWEDGFQPSYPEGALVRYFGVSKFDGHRSAWVVARFRNEAEARAWGEAAVPPERRHYKNSPRSVSEVGDWAAEWTRKYVEQTGGKG